MRDKDIWYAKESEINTYNISLQPDITEKIDLGINIQYKGLYLDRIYPSCDSITPAYKPGLKLSLTCYEIKHNC